MTSDPPHQPDQEEQVAAGPAPAPEEWGLRSQHLDVDTLSAYIDQQLPPAEMAAIRAHLATCVECERDLAELRATVALLRELPQYAPRRNFQLGPEHARRSARGSPLGDWLDRLVPTLPVLRIATAAVAVLLVAVIAGDLVLNRGAEPAPQLQTGSEVERATGPESQLAPAPAEQAPADEEMMPRSVAQPTTEAVAEDGAGGQPGEDGAGGQPAETGTESEAPASSMLEDSAEVDPDVVPPAAEPAPPPSPSGWRLAQLGLGLALLWLIVSLAGVAWLRRDRS